MSDIDSLAETFQDKSEEEDSQDSLDRDLSSTGFLDGHDDDVTNSTGYSSYSSKTESTKEGLVVEEMKRKLREAKPSVSASISRSPTRKGSSVRSGLSKGGSASSTGSKKTGTETSTSSSRQEAPADKLVQVAEATVEYGEVKTTELNSSSPSDEVSREAPGSKAVAKDDDSPKNVIDGPIEVDTEGKPKSLGMYFMDILGFEPSKNDSKSGRSATPKAVATVPSTLEAQSLDSVGDLTATTYEMQVEIEEFKRKIAELERQSHREPQHFSSLFECGADGASVGPHCGPTFASSSVRRLAMSEMSEAAAAAYAKQQAESASRSNRTNTRLVSPPQTVDESTGEFNWI
jgi:hypothetical protein